MKKFVLSILLLCVVTIQGNATIENDEFLKVIADFKITLGEGFEVKEGARFEAVIIPGSCE